MSDRSSEEDDDEPTPAELARMQRASQTNGNGWVHEEVEDRKEDEQ